jgi:hypothetical protein
VLCILSRAVAPSIVQVPEAPHSVGRLLS